MMAAHALRPKLGNWMTNKIGSIVLARGEGAEALKDTALEMVGMEVPKLMAAAVVAVLLPGMTGALLMMIMRTTVALQEAVSRRKISDLCN